MNRTEQNRTEQNRTEQNRTDDAESDYESQVDYSNCIPEVVGGIGDKKSNGGTQWFLQNRIYLADVCITVTTCCMPYFVVKVDGKIKD